MACYRDVIDEAEGNSRSCSAVGAAIKAAVGAAVGAAIKAAVGVAVGAAVRAAP